MVVGLENFAFRAEAEPVRRTQAAGEIGDLAGREIRPDQRPAVWRVGAGEAGVVEVDCCRERGIGEAVAFEQAEVEMVVVVGDPAAADIGLGFVVAVAVGIAQASDGVALRDVEVAVDEFQPKGFEQAGGDFGDGHRLRILALGVGEGPDFSVAAGQGVRIGEAGLVGIEGGDEEAAIGRVHGHRTDLWLEGYRVDGGHPPRGVDRVERLAVAGAGAVARPDDLFFPGSDDAGDSRRGEKGGGGDGHEVRGARRPPL